MTIPCGTVCICCSGASSVPHLMEGLLRCSSCGHVWVNQAYSDEELRALYSASYFQGAEYADYEAEAAALQRNFALRIRELQARHPQGGRLWEIGAAYGYFQVEARRFFEASGCDISEHAAAFARERNGADVRAGDFLSMETGAGYAVVCLWDTVEHLKSPERFIGKGLELLAPGGTLALSTGDIGSLLARWRGRRWRLLHPPTHLHYFTRESMRALLERLGFVDVQIKYDAFWRSVDATLYQLLAAHGHKAGGRVYEGLRRAGLTHWYYPVNTYDLMTVYARKP